MKQLKLILDLTATEKEIQKQQEWLDNHYLYSETILTIYYPNGEHFMTGEVHPNIKAGRKAAKTFMKYCPCTFEDRTKDNGDKR